jgi:hypothetical protein
MLATADDSQRGREHREWPWPPLLESALVKGIIAAARPRSLTKDVRSGPKLAG